MRSIFSLLRSFGAGGAAGNARAELELTYTRRVQAALVERRVHTIDAVAARHEIASHGQPLTISTAA